MSRACLDKYSVASKKWRKKALSHLSLDPITVAVTLLPSAEVCQSVVLYGAGVSGVQRPCPPLPSTQYQGSRPKETYFFEFSLGLSRACLGKKIVFMYKWRKKYVFLTIDGERVPTVLVRAIAARCVAGVVPDAVPMPSGVLPDVPTPAIISVKTAETSAIRVS